MEKTKKESFKSIFKTSVYWILFLFLFYLGIGYFLIPPVVKSKIIKAINNKSDRETTIESVSFNPFTMAFSIEDLVLNDKRRGFVLNCNKFYINLDFLSILKKDIELENIKLSNTELSLKKENATFSFSNLMNNILGKMDSTKSQNEWNIVIRELVTENLGIVLIENSEIKARIDSINIELSNIYPLTQDSTKVEIAADSPIKASFEALFTNMHLYLSVKIPTDTLALDQINN